MIRTPPQPIPFADGAARKRIESDLDTTLFVEAAAGTGKTTCLIRRILAVLRSGRGRLDEMVAVTFTEKAAGEMKLRLRAQIEDARKPGDLPHEERQRLDAALEHLEVARIGTIHAFCADILHERPVEAGVDPLFEVASQSQADRMLKEAFDRWFERELADPPPGVARVLRRRPYGLEDEGPRGRLLSAAKLLANHRDFDAPWDKPSVDVAAGLERALKRLQEIADAEPAITNPDDYAARHVLNIARWLEEVRLMEAVRGRDLEGLEADLQHLCRRKTGWPGWTWRGRGQPFGGNPGRDELLSLRDDIKAELDELLAEFDADLSSRVREELRPVIAAYDEIKQREGKLDFLDLLLKTRNLLVDRNVVRAELQSRFSHFFIDEFQDTDPLQVQILMLLGADDPAATDWTETTVQPGKLFIVGDPKQSIYRFRRADVTTYEAVKQRLVSGGAEVLQLTRSFRSVPHLQDAMNAAFEPVMQGGLGGHQAEYVPLFPHRSDADNQPSLVALPVPRPYGDWGNVTNMAIDASLPDAVGAFVKWLIEESGWTVTERGSDERVPIRSEHICILFRRFKAFFDDVTQPYVRALEDRHVPHVLVGGRGFYEREEVLALRNAITAIEWPEDTLRVYATLRGPFFGFNDADLLTYVTERGHLDPIRVWAADKAQATRDYGGGDDPGEAVGGTGQAREGNQADAVGILSEIDRALLILADLHYDRNRRPIADSVRGLLDQVRAQAGMAIWPRGEQALANCLRFLEMARHFEAEGGQSFRSFVDHVEDETAKGDGAEAPIVEEGTAGVRMMTVHKAKGLEFPVVILADPTAPATHQLPSHHVDAERRLWAETICGAAPLPLLDNQAVELERDAAEAIRVAYVAATRARDLLVVPGVGDEVRDGGWIEVLNAAIYPPDNDWRASRPAPGCPPFGEDTVLERPPQKGPRRAPVKPGLHTSRAGVDVVWWDPRALDLDREVRIGLRQTRLLEADQTGEQAEEGIRRHAAWVAARNQLLMEGARPELGVVRTVDRAAEIVEEQGHAGGSVELHVLAQEADRPGGTRFGRLVHAVLEIVDLEASVEDVDAVMTSQARRYGSSDEEIEAASAAVVAALAHPLIQAAATPGANPRRECPVHVVLDDGRLMEGVIDLAYWDAATGEWVVVDFKTQRQDAEAETLEHFRKVYTAQVELYAAALSRALGQPARGAVLIV